MYALREHWYAEHAGEKLDLTLEERFDYKFALDDFVRQPEHSAVGIVLGVGFLLLCAVYLGRFVVELKQKKGPTGVLPLYATGAKNNQRSATSSARELASGAADLAQHTPQLVSDLSPASSAANSPDFSDIKINLFKFESDFKY